MGVCASGPTNGEKTEFATSRKLDAGLRKDHQKDALVHKLLLLGSGESGKSTMYKQ